MNPPQSSTAVPIPIERVGDQTDILGECPLWHAGEQALYWVDIRQPAIRRLDHASGRVETWTMPGFVGSLALTDEHRLLVAVADRIALFDPSTRTLDTVATLPDLAPDHRFNDGRVDPAGRFWVGTMNNVTRGPEGTLYRLDADGLVRVRSGICIPNSLAWSPDGATMYFADSLRHAIHAYGFDAGHGEIGPERLFAETPPPAFPDGSTVDAEGFLWNAEFHGSRLVRYAPSGAVDRVIPLPVDRPTCCAFGGPDLDILYVTTTSQRMSEAERAAMPLAGALLALRPGVRGLPEPRARLLARLPARTPH